MFQRGNQLPKGSARLCGGRELRTTSAISKKEREKQNYPEIFQTGEKNWGGRGGGNISVSKLGGGIIGLPYLKARSRRADAKGGRQRGAERLDSCPKERMRHEFPSPRCCPQRVAGGLRPQDEQNDGPALKKGEAYYHQGRRKNFGKVARFLGKKNIPESAGERVREGITRIQEVRHTKGKGKGQRGETCKDQNKTKAVIVK